MGGRHPLASRPGSQLAQIAPGRLMVTSEGWHARWAVTPRKGAFVELADTLMRLDTTRPDRLREPIITGIDEGERRRQLDPIELLMERSRPRMRVKDRSVVPWQADATGVP